MTARARLLSAVGAELPPNLVALRSVDSTNSLAKRLVEGGFRGDSNSGSFPEILIWAGEQTAGRGRLGREWVSLPDRGIYLSLMRELAQPGHLERLPIVVAVGLAQSLRQLGVPVGLKWPNDLIAEGCKLGGILIETIARGRDTPLVIIGMGINHGHSSGELPTPESIALRQMLVELPPLDEVVVRLIQGVRTELDRIGDPGRTARLYAELSVHRPGDRIRCQMGLTTIDGAFRGFDSRGFLELEIGDHVRTISSGEIIASVEEGS